MWASIFSFVNLLALIGWAILVLLPRKELLLSVVLYLGVGILCLVYAAGLGHAIWSGAAEADFGSIEGVRAIFASDAGVTVGWTHYLAFDLFVGLWIARDADHKGIGRLWQAPVLITTLMVGPVGLLVWLVVREKYRGPRTSPGPLQRIRR
ncbi:ABA4-like family protein [Parerythrobacter aestuarii]|uniref:ABA4-like family protein n=1 Tax=Parerythrobacter aestuarii TaxID=3020909 RepID=UPI0024DE33CB|nr:ABA4-like family protein [Parerythrobacter aestuarii]